eukprot:1178933-Prorocentrum_minimum.AAC.2
MYRSYASVRYTRHYRLVLEEVGAVAQERLEHVVHPPGAVRARVEKDRRAVLLERVQQRQWLHRQHLLQHRMLVRLQHHRRLPCSAVSGTVRRHSAVSETGGVTAPSPAPPPLGLRRAQAGGRQAADRQPHEKRRCVASANNAND